MTYFYYPFSNWYTITEIIFHIILLPISSTSAFTLLFLGKMKVFNYLWTHEFVKSWPSRPSYPCQPLPTRQNQQGSDPSWTPKSSIPRSLPFKDVTYPFGVFCFFDRVSFYGYLGDDSLWSFIFPLVYIRMVFTYGRDLRS